MRPAKENLSKKDRFEGLTDSALTFNQAMSGEYLSQVYYHPDP